LTRLGGSGKASIRVKSLVQGPYISSTSRDNPLVQLNKFMGVQYCGPGLVNFKEMRTPGVGVGRTESLYKFGILHLSNNAVAISQI